MKTTVIHHSADFDGIFCREIARKFLPDAELIGWDFGQPILPFPTGKVYVLDLPCDAPFGLKFAPGEPNDLDFSNFVWIDHHKSAIESHPDIPGWRIDGVAACRLAWHWFDIHAKLFHPTGGSFSVPLPSKQDFIDRKVNEPMAVRLAGEYDIWDKRDPNAELFQHGLRSRDLSSYDWEMILSNDVDSALKGTGMEQPNSELICAELLGNGRVLQYSKTKENEAIIKRQGFDVDFEGLHFLACNHAMFNSHLFTAGIRPEHDALMGFRFDGKHYHISLYHAPGKEHHDLSLIAAKFGGGGHRGACGFRTKSLALFCNP